MSYLSWHFTHVPLLLVAIGRNFVVFFYHYFSVGELAATLFAPWKGLHTGKRGSGFSPDELLNRISFNIISRVVGAVVRSFTILTGLLTASAFVIIWTPVIIAWILLPGVTIPLYLYQRRTPARSTRAPTPQPAREYLKHLLAREFGQFFTTRLLLHLEELLAQIEPDLTITPPPLPEPQLVPQSAKLQRYFARHRLTPADLHSVHDWFMRREQQVKKQTAFWELDHLLRIPSIGKQWRYGYTPTLDQFTIELGQRSAAHPTFVGRATEIELLERILSRRGENNALVIGEPGVGAHSMVEHLAYLIAIGRVLPALEARRMVRLDLERVFGSGDMQQQKKYLTQLLDEARAAGNIVLVIDQFDRFVASGADRVDVSDVFIHAIADSRLQVIALLTPGAYQQFIHPNRQLDELFETVVLHEPSQTQVLQILQENVVAYETQTMLFSYQALREIVTVSDRYIKDTPFPEKAIDVAGLVAAAMKSKQPPKQRDRTPSNTTQYTVITPDNVRAVVSEKIKTPITVSAEEKQTLLHLEDALHKRVINQHHAIAAVSDALRRARADVSARGSRPLGVFLFLGPTGVGKTETAKALAESFYGADSHLARFDMSEFTGSDSVNRLLGDFQTRAPGVFAAALRDNPYTLVLLDEFEKAHPQVLNLFLAAFDEGFITDAFGKKVYLTNTIIIATSNAGSEYIRRRVAEAVDHTHLRAELIEYVQRKQIVSPELLNRFDGVVVFEPLTAEHATQILDIMLARLNAKLHQTHQTTVQLRPQTRKKILDAGFNTEFGARELARALTKYVENPLSRRVLEGTIVSGKTVII